MLRNFIRRSPNEPGSNPYLPGETLEKTLAEDADYWKNQSPTDSAQTPDAEVVEEEDESEEDKKADKSEKKDEKGDSPPSKKYLGKYETVEELEEGAKNARRGWQRERAAREAAEKRLAELEAKTTTVPTEETTEESTETEEEDEEVVEDKPRLHPGAKTTTTTDAEPEEEEDETQLPEPPKHGRVQVWPPRLTGEVSENQFPLDELGLEYRDPKWWVGRKTQWILYLAQQDLTKQGREDEAKAITYQDVPNLRADYGELAEMKRDEEKELWMAEYRGKREEAAAAYDKWEKEFTEKGERLQVQIGKKLKAQLEEGFGYVGPSDRAGKAIRELFALADNSLDELESTGQIQKHQRNMPSMVYVALGMAFARQLKAGRFPAMMKAIADFDDLEDEEDKPAKDKKAIAKTEAVVKKARAEVETRDKREQTETTQRAVEPEERKAELQAGQSFRRGGKVVKVTSDDVALAKSYSSLQKRQVTPQEMAWERIKAKEQEED